MYTKTFRDSIQRKKERFNKQIRIWYFTKVVPSSSKKEKSIKIAHKKFYTKKNANCFLPLETKSQSKKKRAPPTKKEKNIQKNTAYEKK